MQGIVVCYILIDEIRNLGAKKFMKRYFPFIILILFLVMIFGFSSQNMVTSKGLSYDISLIIERVLFKVENKAYNFEKIHYTVRKLAHFIEYMMLSVVLTSGLSKLFRKIIPALLISGILCIGIAYFDEMLQSVSIERTSSFFDVIIDGAGAITGLLAIGIFSFFRWLEAPKNKK